MDQDIRKTGDVINKSILALQKSVNNSLLLDNEKNAIIQLLAKMMIYYNTKKELIMNKSIGDNAEIREKLDSLKVFMTDIIVEINEVLYGSNNNIPYFVSIINKRLNDKDVNKVLKKK